MQTLDLLSIGLGLLFGALLPRIIHLLRRMFTLPHIGSKINGIAAQMNLQWAIDGKPPKKNPKFRDLREPLPNTGTQIGYRKTMKTNAKPPIINVYASQNQGNLSSIPSRESRSRYSEAKNRALIFRLQTLNSRLCDEDVLTNPQSYHRIVEQITSLQESLNGIEKPQTEETTSRGIIL